MPKAKTQTKQSSRSQTRAPRGQVGQQTYDQVRALIDQRDIPVGQAIKEVAQSTGRSQGTVAVTYYRMARQQGGSKGRKPVAKAQGPKAVVRTTGAGTRGAQALISQITASLAQLQAIVAQQAEEMEQLRSESNLAERIRKAFQG